MFLQCARFGQRSFMGSMAMHVGIHMNTCGDTLCICSHSSEARSLQLPFPHPPSSSTLPRSFLLPVLCGVITARTWLSPSYLLCSACLLLTTAWPVMPTQTVGIGSRTRWIHLQDPSATPTTLKRKYGVVIAVQTPITSPRRPT